MPETQTLTLTDFLLARIAEDEAELTEGRVEWMRGDDSFHRKDRWLQFNPDNMVVSVGYGRALAECEAKRETIRLAVDYLVPYTGDSEESLLRHLALPYADHPDFRAEWAL